MNDRSSATGPKQPSAPAIETWIGLMRASRRIAVAIESELKAAGLPPLDWYDVLLELDRADGPGLRQYELQPRLLLAQYNVSRLLSRLETAGLIKCVDCEEDRRARVVSLTGAGRAMRHRMWAVYGPAIERHVGEPLAEHELRELADVLGKLGG